MSIAISPRLKKLLLVLCGLLVVVLVLLGILLFQQKQSGGILEVDFLDIGQGDSILIKTPQGDDILIDGGPDASVLDGLGRNLPFYDRDIELMILTHPHSDHVAGLVEVLKRYEVKKVLYTGVLHTSPDYLEWLKIIKEKNIPLEIVKAGDGFQFGTGLHLDILYPFEELTNQKFKELNDSSIVSRLVYGQISFLLTGDAPVEVEEKLLDSVMAGQLKSDVLKVGHHGSRYSSSPEFLKAVKPQYAVIQCGKDNKFGHPHLSTLKKLENLGIKIFRNDLDGEIKIESDGMKLEVKNK